MGAPILTNIAHADAGTTITFATSHDQHYPPESCIDGEPTTFWATTGLYPQEIILTFGAPVEIDHCVLSCSGVKDFALEKSDRSATKFEELSRQTIEDPENGTTTIKLNDNEVTARHLKLKILSGHGPFCMLRN